MIDPAVWTDNWFSPLAQPYKLVWLWLITHPRIAHCGILELNLREAELHTGLTRGDVESALGRFSEDGRIVMDGDWVWIVRFIEYQTYNVNWRLGALKGAAKLVAKTPLAKRCIEHYSQKGESSPNIPESRGDILSDQIRSDQKDTPKSDDFAAPGNGDEPEEDGGRDAAATATDELPRDDVLPGGEVDLAAKAWKAVCDRLHEEGVPFTTRVNENALRAAVVKASRTTGGASGVPPGLVPEMIRWAAEQRWWREELGNQKAWMSGAKLRRLHQAYSCRGMPARSTGGDPVPNLPCAPLRETP